MPSGRRYLLWRMRRPGLQGLARLRDRLLRDREKVSARLESVEAQMAGLGVEGPPIPRPLHCDWAWRPDAWSRPLRPSGLVAPAPGTRLGPEIAVFHDCPLAELALRQRPAPAAGLALALDIEIFGFSGSFLSLALDLPAAALAGLGADHILAAEADLTCEVPFTAQARLNLRQGPEHRQLARGLSPGKPVEFDLAAMGLDQRRIEAAWLDLLFQAPGPNRITVSDLTLTRRPRAAF